jgi:DNA topoisomerase VI subunit B
MAKETYAIVHQPEEIRKNLLYCSKDIITALKEYESYLQQKQERKEVMQKVPRILKQIKIMVGRITKMLPEAERKKSESVSVVKRPTPTTTKKIDKLESELSKIEERLAKLS